MARWNRSGRFLALFVVVVSSLFAGATSALAQAQAPIEGVWRTALASEITIMACPEGFCGHLSRIVVPEGLLSGAEAEAAA